MSLINQMLTDLDARRATAAEGHALPPGVRAASGAARATGRRWWRLSLLAGGLLLAGGAGWYASRGAAPEALPPLAAEASAVALPASAAVPQAPVVAPAPVPGSVPVAQPTPVLVPSGSAAPVAAGAARPAPSATGDVAPRLRMSALTLPLPAAAAPAAAAGTAVTDAPAAATANGGRQDAMPRAENSPRIDKQERPLEPRERAERLYQQALAGVSRGRQGTAVELLQRALREDPGHVPSRQLLVKLLLDSRALPAAAAALEEGVRVLPAQTDWVLLLSRLQVDQGDAVAALRTLEGSQGQAGGRADYPGAIGAVLYRMGRHAESEARYAVASRQEAGNGRWWVGLAMAQEAQGKEREARESYRRALASDGLAAELRAYAESRLR